MLLSLREFVQTYATSATFATLHYVFWAIYILTPICILDIMPFVGYDT
jgi:hypothetical protein